MRFKQFISDELFIEFAQTSFQGNVNSGNPVGLGSQPQGNKPWSAKKDEIMAMWQRLRNDLPIQITPMEERDGHTQTYGEDGIRITGSWPFIASVLGRIKDLLVYESPRTKLRLIFRGIDKARDVRPDRQTYVFYVNAENRKYGKAGRPRTGQSQLPHMKKGTGND